MDTIIIIITMGDMAGVVGEEEMVGAAVTTVGGAGGVTMDNKCVII